ncbi:hypothetical protein ACUN7V_16300 [Quadrisphaera oryzae]|uniref:hypothetical protein n=1 Tax=Quadrisphaera TaxID=317661 RepID=UPI001645FBFC|nr:hypothetical protein [Quadrisphaera sp. RL12-1S]MBC3763585.1 hypothetical protein [Quadrisphaera sp. RL12-1S]
MSAAAWLVWLSWADDEPTLAAWQVLGVIATLMCAVVVGVPRVGALRAWALTVVPFAAFGAYSLIGSDPLGAIGAVVWIGLVVVGVSAMVGLVVGVRAVVTSRRSGRREA